MEKTNQFFAGVYSCYGMALLIGVLGGCLISAASSPPDPTELRTCTDANNACNKQLGSFQQKIAQLEEELKGAQRELKDTKARLAAGPSYQLHKETDGRTWRFDKVTGKVCLLLAPDSDWKNPKTAAQACSVEQ